MEEIEQFLKESIHENTGVLVDKSDKNIFEYEVSPLDLLYVIFDIEQKYDVTAKDILHNIPLDLFTVGHISKIISEKKMVINA